MFTYFEVVGRGIGKQLQVNVWRLKVDPALKEWKIYNGRRPMT